MKPAVAICIVLLAPLLRAADRVDIAIGPGFAMLSGTVIQGTGERLHFEPRAAIGENVSLLVSDRLWIALSSAQSRMPIALQSATESHRHVGRARIVPIYGALLVPFGSDRIQLYGGAGVLFIFVRHADLNRAAPDVHALYIEQPDHVALLLEGGSRVAFGPRSSLMVDAKFGPAPSTMEVAFDSRRNLRQTNVHPLILTASLGHRF